MCYKVVSEDPFSIVYCSDKYITQRMCDEANESLAALKLIPDWLITSKMIKKLFTALHVDKNILHFNEDSGNVVFNCNEIGILNVDLNNINFDSHLMKMILILLFLSYFWPGILNLKNTKNKKSISK